MMRFPRAGFTVVGLFVAFVATWGCGNKETGPAVSTPPEGWQQRGQMGGGPGGPGGPGRGRSPLGELMNKLDKGPNSLKTIDGALRADPPQWETIQAQTKEYAQGAAEVAKLDPPPKGAKESWANLSATFAASAAALDKAAQAKDLVAAQSAATKIQGSCKACHDAHRGGPGGPGGFGPGGRGGPGGGRGGPGGGRPGGPPPGGN